MTMRGIVKETPQRGATYRTDLPIPKVGSDELLIRVEATAICGTDLHIYEWTPWAAGRVPIPMVFGHEFAGEIVETGPQVRRFKPGQRVAGETHIGCGTCPMCLTGNMHNCEQMQIIGVHTPGAFAEYIAIPDSCAWLLGESLSYRLGSCLEPMGVAMHGLQVDNVGGKDIVILGAGPIGAMAVGIARFQGAHQIIVSEPIAERLEVAARMGATALVQPGEKDLVETVMNLTDGRGADIVIDYSGNSQAIADAFFALRKGGHMVLVGLPSKNIELNLTDAIIYREARVTGVTGRLMYSTWIECQRLLQTGKFDMNQVIWGEYRMDDFDAAFRAALEGAPGKVLLIP